MRNDPIFIDDGYTARAYVEAVPGLHGALHFEYRPMLSPERCKQAELMNKEPADKFDKICAESVAAKLASWSVVDRKGNAVACTPANLLKLHPQLWSKLYNIVAGYRPTDALPDEPAAPRLPGGEIQEADSKN